MRPESEATAWSELMAKTLPEPLPMMMCLEPMVLTQPELMAKALSELMTRALSELMAKRKGAAGVDGNGEP